MSPVSTVGMGDHDLINFTADLELIRHFDIVLHFPIGYLSSQ